MAIFVHLCTYLQIAQVSAKTMEDGGVDRTVIDRLAKWQTFRLFKLFKLLTYKKWMFLKLNLRPCGTHA